MKPRTLRGTDYREEDGMRRRKATVELFEEIRREYEFGVGTIQGVARKFGVHQRLVRETLTTAVPVENHHSPPAPCLTPLVPFIEAILEGDRQATPHRPSHLSADPGGIIGLRQRETF